MTDRASREETPRTKEQELDAIGMREYTNSRDALSDAYDAGRSSQAAPPTPTLCTQCAWHHPEKCERPVPCREVANLQHQLDVCCEAVKKQLSDSSPAGAAPPLTAITDLPRFWRELVDAGYLCRNVQHLTASGEECDVCEKLKESRAGAAPQWVSIEDSEIVNGREYLVFLDGIWFLATRYNYGVADQHWQADDGHAIKAPQKVYSLPAPPRGVTDHA